MKIHTDVRPHPEHRTRPLKPGLAICFSWFEDSSVADSVLSPRTPVPFYSWSMASPFLLSSSSISLAFKTTEHGPLKCCPALLLWHTFLALLLPLISVLPALFPLHTSPRIGFPTFTKVLYHFNPQNLSSLFSYCTEASSSFFPSALRSYLWTSTTLTTSVVSITEIMRDSPNKNFHS